MTTITTTWLRLCGETILSWLEMGNKQLSTVLKPDVLLYTYKYTYSIYSTVQRFLDSHPLCNSIREASDRS